MRAFPNHVMYDNFGQLDIFHAYKLDCFISWFEETKQWSSEGLVLVTSDRLATMMPNELEPQFLHSSGFSIGICKVGKCWQFANPNTITVLSNPIFIFPHPSVRSGTWCEATHLTIFSTAEQIEVEEQSTARRTSFAGLIAFSMALSTILSILLRWRWCTEWYRYGCKLPVATRWGEPTCCFAFFSVHALFFHPNSDLALTKVYIVYPGLPWLFLIVSY